RVVAGHVDHRQLTFLEDPRPLGHTDHERVLVLDLVEQRLQRRPDHHVNDSPLKEMAGESVRSPPAHITPGGDLLSRAVARAVPSALKGLTTVFGMGTGVTPPASPPRNLANGGKAAPYNTAMARAFGSRRPWQDNRYTRGASTPVLSY